MSARGAQSIKQADSLAGLRRRMIREVEMFLEWSIALSENSARRIIPTKASPPPPPPPTTTPTARTAGGPASWYDGSRGRPWSAAAAGVPEAGSC